MCGGYVGHMPITRSHACHMTTSHYMNTVTCMSHHHILYCKQNTLITILAKVSSCLSCQLLSGQVHLDANQLLEALTGVCNDSQHIAVVSAWSSVCQCVHWALSHQRIAHTIIARSSQGLWVTLYYMSHVDCMKCFHHRQTVGTYAVGIRTSVFHSIVMVPCAATH